MASQSLAGVPSPRLKRSWFDLTHDRKYTCKIGKLVPCCVIETVPGDKFTIEPHLLIKWSPLIAPIQHEVTATIHFFYVPYLQLWDNWNDFINYQEAPGDTTEPTHPYRS